VRELDARSAGLRAKAEQFRRAAGS